MIAIVDGSAAQRCRGTPTVAVVDNRGLAVRTVQYNRTAVEGPLDELISQQTFSPRGHLCSSIDPRLLDKQRLNPEVQPNFLYLSSLTGGVLRRVSQDAGTLTVLYDIDNGPVWQQDSRGQQLSRTFDVLHRLTSVAERAGDVTRLSERRFYADSSASADANLRGQLLQLYSPAGMTAIPGYSITGQVLQEQQQFLRDAILRSDWAGNDPARWNADLTAPIYITRWDFNAQGVQVQRTDAHGNQQRQGYNITGQLASSALLLAGQTLAHSVLRAIDYSAGGQPLHEEAGNGVRSDYVYAPQTQRLSTLTTTRPVTTGRASLLQALCYQYDPVGNLLSISDNAKGTQYTRNQRVTPDSFYTYDALYQLIQAQGRENANAGQQSQALPPAIVPLWQQTTELTHYTRHYHYDRGSNLTAIRHVGLHAYTQQMVVSQTSNRAVQHSTGLTPGDVDSYFDGCGNLLQLAPGQPMAWDTRNQLQRTTQVVRSGPDDDHEAYWYDSQGQRATKLGTTHTSGITRTQRVRYLPGLELRVAEQTQSDSTTVTEALQVIQVGAAGRQSLRVLHWQQGKPASIDNDQYRYSLDDQLGSSLLEVDQRADILTWEEYFPFGGTAVWSARNETETQYKFVRYSGQERDATGLYYYGLRYYAPWLARWLNPDPAGTIDGLNVFAFVSGNPLRLKDDQGLSKIDLSNLTDAQREKAGLNGAQSNPAVEMHKREFSWFDNGAVREPSNRVYEVDEELFINLQSAAKANRLVKAVFQKGAANQIIDLWRSREDLDGKVESFRKKGVVKANAIAASLGIGNCCEQSRLSYRLLASATGRKVPVFRVAADGVDHAFVVIGDHRILSPKKLVFSDPWPTFPQAHLGEHGIFSIGRPLNTAPPGFVHPSYRVDEKILDHGPFVFPVETGSEQDEETALENINAVEGVYMQWFSLKHNQVGVDYKYKSAGNFPTFGEQYVEDRLNYFQRYLEVEKRMNARARC